MLRLVSFDALYTVLRPRQPVHVQYADAFAPFFGIIPPDALKPAFKDALNHLQSSRPAYAQGPESWWAAVIASTALGAGVPEPLVREHLTTLVPQLLHRFSSREGYALYDDTIPTRQFFPKSNKFRLIITPVKNLRAMGIATALVSNADSRILLALDDLGALSLLDPVLASDLEGVEKPQQEIFLRACRLAGVKPEEAVHVGDEMQSDYHGAARAGLHALLLCRPSEDPAPEEELESKTDDGIRRIKSLNGVVRFVREHNV